MEQQEPTKKQLQERVERLEARVAELERQISAESVSTAPSPKQAAAESPREQPARKQWSSESFQFGEEWLNRIGIGLLLIGVAFLFKYSIDQGWLIPPVRSMIGLGIGLGLFVSGLQMDVLKKPMKQILLGGGIAAFYITGFATFQLYSFVPGMVVWLFMVIVTLLAFSLSLQQDEAVLSVIGTLGAFGTPFMLYTGNGSIISLMFYFGLVLLAAAGIYLVKGWRSMLWSIFAGGFGVLAVGIVNTFSESGTVTTEQASLMAGTVLWAIASWLVPLWRTMLSAAGKKIGDIPIEEPVEANMLKSESVSSAVSLLVFLVPLFLLMATAGIWEFTMEQAGITSLVVGALGGLIYFPLSSKQFTALASMHTFMALVMATIGIVFLLEGNVLFIVLAAEMVGLRYVAFQTGDNRISISSHILFGIIVFWLLDSLQMASSDGAVLLSVESASQLVTIASAGLLVPYWLKKKDVKLIYLLTNHLLLLGWLYVRFESMSSGQAWITISWGVYAIILLVLGFISYGKRLRLTGMGTIFLVVAKLFLVDLSQLEAIWRILLFIGFGAAFLLLGYYWQAKWSSEEKTELSNK